MVYERVYRPSTSWAGASCAANWPAPCGPDVPGASPTGRPSSVSPGSRLPCGHDQRTPRRGRKRPGRAGHHGADTAVPPPAVPDLGPGNGISRHGASPSRRASRSLLRPRQPLAARLQREHLLVQPWRAGLHRREGPAGSSGDLEITYRKALPLRCPRRSTGREPWPGPSRLSRHPRQQTRGEPDGDSGDRPVQARLRRRGRRR